MGPKTEKKECIQSKRASVRRTSRRGLAASKPNTYMSERGITLGREVHQETRVQLKTKGQKETER